MTEALTAELLGRKENEDGIMLVGESTTPPYAGIYHAVFHSDMNYDYRGKNGKAVKC